MMRITVSAIYIHKDHKELGPYTEQEVRLHWANGLIDSEDLAWEENMLDWVLLKNFFNAPHTKYVANSPPPTLAK